MRQFMDENFLLKNKTAERLFHDFAKEMPIYDYHCHLNPKEIANNKSYKNMTEVWLGGDHYKWRAMRSNGVDERFITGDAGDEEKFMKWAETIPYCIGNPLYHWTHLELKRYFSVDSHLTPATAKEIYHTCNDMLKEERFTARGLIKNSNVKVICTTDDPIDDLASHKVIQGDKSFNDVKVLPAFRPDKGINIDKVEFASWIKKLGDITDKEIMSLDDLLEALEQRVQYFHEVGCRLSDHALDPIVYEEGSTEEVNLALMKALNGEELSNSEIKKYKTFVLNYLGCLYAKYDWVMQLHMGTVRNNNSRMMDLLGPDTGFDAIDDSNIARPLLQFLNSLERTNKLPKTILYCLNPKDNEVLGTALGCFQGGGVAGKIQFGSGWWFNDQKDGMIRQMTALANLGLLSRFVGMLTDSRSFLSYTRHEYFRRILCNMIGTWVEEGEYPNDLPWLGKMIQDISYNNAERYFNL
ncbi:glucuronate isomerase [Vallitalea okinawensis]|uniref:glucuronate isomerase n=1 Tax=Vallitalea okinawensis TaxID=2078660 RepID=UPI000CFC62E6|nr:glucuronate isomerase [Vallitalea okinawensis]